MRCWRIYIRRTLASYVDGTLKPPILSRLEDHLLDCGECRARLEHVLAGDRMARQAPFFKPVRDPWIAIQDAIERSVKVASARPFSEPLIGKYRRRLITGRVLTLALVLAIGLLGLFVLSKRDSSQKQFPSTVIDRDEFREISIAAIAQSTEPHVVVEGYVAEVRFNSEENDLSFKLVENLSQPRPFIICEIIGPMKMSLPPVGSRVRVYGVSRFDSQPDHQWYEVHPVLKLEIVEQPQGHIAR